MEREEAESLIEIQELWCKKVKSHTRSIHTQTAPTQCQKSVHVCVCLCPCFHTCMDSSQVPWPCDGVRLSDAKAQ